MYAWGWKAINRLFLSLAPARHKESDWVFVLEAEKQGTKMLTVNYTRLSLMATGLQCSQKRVQVSKV